MKKNYNGIDLFKFIMAFLVVAMHLTPLAMFGEGTQFVSLVFTMVAVPFFFCASGFFLRIKLESSDNYSNTVFNFAKRVLLLYLIWTIIYIPCIVFWYYNEHKTIIRFLQECVFDGSYLHLWFLPSLIIASLLVSWLFRKISIEKIMIIAGILYVIGLPDTCWYNAITNKAIKGIISNYDKIFLTTRNGLFFGMIFVAIGFFAVEKNIELKASIIGAIISFICLFIEMVIYKYNGFMRTSPGVLFSIPFVYFIFQLAKNLNLKNNHIYVTLRHMGVLIYFGHCWVDFTYSILLFNILHTRANSMIRYLYTIIIIVPIAYIITRLQKKEKLRWLKNLY